LRTLFLGLYQQKRISGGDFDDGNFDSTSYNRGWITITYLVA
jgi:hypothetical protein